MIRDVVVAGMAGFVATKLMEPVSTKLHELESPRARAQEERVRPGPPYRIAARIVTEMVGLDLDERQLDAAGMAAHYGLGMSWALAYPVPRDRGMGPFGAALTTGQG